MYGVTMKVSHNGLVVVLRALRKEDVPILVEHFSSMKVHMYTKGIFAQTLENELEWYEKNRKDPDGVTWAIQPEENEFPIGVTALHGINSRENSSSSGIIIWDPSWWGKGVASAAHLARTLFAADYLNRGTIRSSVRVANEASRRALERVGYTIWGTEPACILRANEWLDTYRLIWFHPERTDIFYPDGIPQMYQAGVERARAALEIARREVSFP